MFLREPFFSVVIPCYNRKELICDAISSVLSQTFMSFEIVIVDDGSTDDTRGVVEAMSASEPRIKYIYQKNRERGAARNVGILQAQGRWICFLDSDDIMLPSHLEEIYSAANMGFDESIMVSRYYFDAKSVSNSGFVTGIPSGRIHLNLLLSGNPFACNFSIINNRDHPLLFREERCFATMEDWLFLVTHCESDGIRLLDSTTIMMREHDGRSVKAHRRLVDSRRAATKFLSACLVIDDSMRARLQSNSAYFCSIHLFLLGDRFASFNEFLKFVMGPVSLTNKVLQFLRIVFGPSIWKYLRLLLSKYS